MHKTLGTYLIDALEALGVRHVFGIPGVHNLELYRGLAASSIRHVAGRHEQGLGFMADGYARVSGNIGVCFTITGPGLTNILTAMGQAYADSIPVLVILPSFFGFLSTAYFTSFSVIFPYCNKQLPFVDAP